MRPVKSIRYELIRGRGLVAYPDEQMRRAIGQAIVVETPRGWRIAKEKARHKIDVVVALAMAALTAVQSGRGERSIGFAASGE